MSGQIMIVGRNVALRARLAQLLNGGGHRVAIAENAVHARRLGLEGVALAIVAPERLDPEGKGLLQELRATVGAVLLVATPDGKRELRSADVLDVSDEAGLLARVAEAVAPAPEADDVEPVLNFADYRIDLAGHSLFDPSGKEIPLTPGEFGLLRAFVERAGRVLSRDQLLQLTAGRDAETYDRSIDMQMVRLRRKIEQDPRRPSLIVTVPGSGYKFSARVTAEAVGAPGATPGEAASPPAPPSPSAPSPERRQLTIMQCALSGAAFESAQRDPEDLHRLLTAFHESCVAIIAEAGGGVAKLLNDGVLAYFGYPQADEHQAERAIRAARRLVQASGRADVGQTNGVQARVAIATGLVLVGGLFRDSGEQVVLGEPASLAAGLVARAASGTVLISASTRRLVGELFRCEERGPIALPGFSEAIAVWQVVREGAAENRFEALHGQHVAALVGREEELALLLRRWDQAKAGEGCAVLISGEAGIGKSRVLAELAERIGEEPHVALRYQCSPHHVNDAFFPIASQIRRAAGFAGGEPYAARLDKLEAMIARSGLEAMDIAPFLATLLEIPFEGRYPRLEMGASEQRERTIAALIALFEGLTKDAPVLVALEDAHWIDPTSLDVFSRLVDRLPNLRALLVVTFRPEFAAPWVGGAQVASLVLGRLGRRQALAMVAGVVGGKTLPAEVLDDIVAKTDGVPLFVEELTKTVLESGLLREANGAYVLDDALTPLAIPATLQDSLMARLDRLAPVKEIAQIGAAIGREFSYRLLEAVSPIHGPTLQDALGQLMTAELIHARGAAPEATYVFKHALVQDTAHASLLRSQRQRVHADIAQALVERFSDQIESAPARIALHYAEAGLNELAAQYWLKGAELALSRSAPVEAGRYANAGLALIPGLNKGPERQALELTLQVARANALMQIKGYAAPETVAALTVAKQLLDAGIGTDLQRFFVLSGLCPADYIAGQMEPALALARQLVEVADRQDDLIYRLVGYRYLGASQIHMGQSREGFESLQQAERCREPHRQKPLSYRFGYDPGLAVLCWKVFALTVLGRLSQAAQISEQMHAELTRHTHAPTVAACLGVGAVMPQLLLGDFEACEGHSAELVAYCTKKGVEFFRLLAGGHHACARAMREPTEENRAAIRHAIEAYHRSGARSGDSICYSCLAEASLAAGDVVAAERALEEAFAYVEQSGERYWLADLHRLGGLIALKRKEPDRAQAEVCFLRAIEIARNQEARVFELRAAADLARLWRDTDSVNDPCTLIEPILAAIEGGDATSDVRNARALLAEVVCP